MANWDVFHSTRLEVERGLDDAAVRAALAQGDLTEDDLIRPAGSGSPWERLGDRLDVLIVEPPASTPPQGSTTDVVPPPPRPVEPPARPDATEWSTEILDRAGWKEHETVEDDDVDIEALKSGPDFEQVDPETSTPALLAFVDDEDDEDDDEEGLKILDDEEPAPAADAYSKPASAGPILPPLESAVAIPVPGPAPLPFDEEELEAEFDGEDEYDPLEEDEAVAEFTLARGSAERVEELDLAAMVDVAFQLVLFFLVTATTVFYKSLEVPKPSAEAPPEAAQQGNANTIEEKMKDFILVEIDPTGVLKIDRQPVDGALTRESLASRLRKLREDTGRRSMLLSADYVTPHRLTVLAYDAANEIGMGISIAKPAAPGGKANAPPPAVKKG
jgi:biopolymer transport protein ExbD